MFAGSGVIWKSVEFDAEVIDPIWLSPLDIETIVASVCAKPAGCAWSTMAGPLAALALKFSLRVIDVYRESGKSVVIAWVSRR